MSMPYSVVYCDRCSYRGATFIMWGIFRYRFDDGHETYIDRMLGWCSGCGGVQPIERLPNRAEIEKELDATRRRLRKLNPTGLIGRLTLMISRRRHEEVGQLRERERDLEHLSLMVASRTASARCLECSSVSVSPMPISPHEEKHYDHPIGVVHPGCDGALRIRDSGGSRLAFAFEPRVYDLDGRPITVDRKGNDPT